MGVSVSKVRLVNPTAKRAGGRKPAKRKQSNPALWSLGYLNPQKKGRTMARKTKKRASTANKPTARRRPNPRKPMHRRRSARRGNPNMTMFGTSANFLKLGFFALIGLVVTRQLPQMVLGARNTGAVGYLANIATTILSVMIGNRMAGKDVGQALGVGGGLYTANRFISENLSPVGKVLSLSGVGDAMALGSPRGMGTIMPGYFPTPVPTAADGSPIIPEQINAAAVRALIASNAKNGGGKGMSGRWSSRYRAA